MRNTKDTKIIINLPDKISIDLVPANELKHYERFQWLALLLAPIAAGFWTASLTIPDGKSSLFFSAIIFTLITILFIILAFLSRRKMFNGKVKKEITLDKFK